MGTEESHRGSQRESGSKLPHSKWIAGIRDRCRSFFGKAGNCGVLEVLPRPASEGEPYTEKVVEATACEGRRPYNGWAGG